MYVLSILISYTQISSIDRKAMVKEKEKKDSSKRRGKKQIEQDVKREKSISLKKSLQKISYSCKSSLPFDCMQLYGIPPQGSHLQEGEEKRDESKWMVLKSEGIRKPFPVCLCVCVHISWSISKSRNHSKRVETPDTTAESCCSSHCSGQSSDEWSSSVMPLGLGLSRAGTAMPFPKAYYSLVFWCNREKLW